MKYKELGHEVEVIRGQLTPASLEKTCRELMRQGEDIGGGINALRLAKYLLRDPQMTDAQAVWAYDRLKPTFREAFQEIPSLYYFEGD